MRAHGIRNRIAVPLLAAAAVALAVCASRGLLGSALLTMLPALAFAALLLMRRYPGEGVLIARRRSSRKRRREPFKPRAFQDLLVAAVRGAQLMGRSLAVRPPPALRAAG